MRAWLRGPTVAQAMERPLDNFAALRLALALAVVVSHGVSVVTGRVSDEPLAASTGFTLGEHAVNAFFAISGFLVTMSFCRRGGADYALARALRILPGLVAAVLATALLLGPALSTLGAGAYLAEPGTWRFVWATLTSFKTNIALPGVFPDNPFRIPLGTVWTLKYEILCYVGVGAAGLLLRSRLKEACALLVAGLAVAVAALDVVAPDADKGLQTSLRLPLIFAAGAALYLWRDRVMLSWPVLAGVLVAVAAAWATPLHQATLFLASAYVVLFLALAPSHPSLDLKADLSYGVYLYGWPVQQALRQLFPEASILQLLGPSLAFSLLIAAISWYVVEKPALALKARLLGRREVRSVAPAAP